MYFPHRNKHETNVLQYKTWQLYRDGLLLQRGSNTQLHFSHPGLEDSLSVVDPVCIRIVMGKTFAESLLADIDLAWLDKDFAINKKRAIIVCPYFDYRQLSNAKIETLVKLVSSMHIK